MKALEFITELLWIGAFLGFAYLLFTGPWAEVPVMQITQTETETQLQEQTGCVLTYEKDVTGPGGGGASITGKECETLRTYCNSSGDCRVTHFEMFDEDVLVLNNSLKWSDTRERALR